MTVAFTPSSNLIKPEKAMSTTPLQAAANAEAAVQSAVTSVVTQGETDYQFVKAHWLKVNLIIIAAGLAGFVVGQFIHI